MFNRVDFIIIGLLGFFSYFFGFKKGLVGVILLLCTWALSFLVASMASRYAGALIMERINIPYIWVRGACFLLLLGITYGAIRLLGRIFNRLGGAVCAALLGIALVGIGATYLLRLPSERVRNFIRESAVLRGAAALVAGETVNMSGGEKSSSPTRDGQLNGEGGKPGEASNPQVLKGILGRGNEKEEAQALHLRYRTVTEMIEQEIAEINENLSKARKRINELEGKLSLVRAEKGLAAKRGELLLFFRREEKVRTPVVEVPPLLSRKMEGEVLVVAPPFLSLELDREAVAGLQPALSIYRRGGLIRELGTRGIRHVILVVRVVLEEDLEGIRENDQVKLSLTPGVTEMFTAPRMEGEILDVIRPGFLNINLGREGLENVEPTLLIYRDGELFRKIELKDLDHLTIMVEVVEEANLRGIRRKNRVTLTR